MDNIFDFLRETIAKLLVINKEEIALETSIRGEIAASSLDWMNIMSAIEKRYQLKMAWHLVKSIDTVGDLAKWVGNFQVSPAYI